MGESLRNLVHRRKLVADGVTFVARRVERGKEFLASTDPWFHAVNFATGPDGALYIVDFYRRFVEHPHYVPEKLRNSQPWRTGSEHGRIWRVVNKNRELQRRAPKLDTATPTELVAFLKHTNAWQRDTAQRLLVERQSPEVVPLLKQVLAETNPIAAVHALWILDVLGALDDKSLAQATQTREHMLCVAERRGFMPKVNSDDPRVALQLILSLGQMQSVDASARLAEMAMRYSGSRWHALALLSSVAQKPDAFIKKLVGTAVVQSPSDAQKEFLQQLGKLLQGRGLEAVRDAPVIARLALGEKSLAAEAERIAKDRKRPMIDRLIAIETLKGANLLELLGPDQPPEVQQAAINAMIPGREKELFAAWNAWSPKIRKLILAKAARASSVAVIDALESNIVSAFEIDPASRETLRKTRDPRVEIFFAVNRDREQVVRRFESALKLEGDAAKGRALFEAKCMTCHAKAGQGNSVGPDLSGISSRPKEALLVDILDPSRQVAPDFAAYSVVLKDGDPISGLIVAENENGITVRRPNEVDAVLQRGQIREIRADGKSLMPEGLEEGMTMEDMADLLRFLAR